MIAHLKSLPECHYLLSYSLKSLRHSTHQLRVPLAEVADVVGEDGEVVGDAVLVAELDDDGQAHARRGVARARRLRGRRALRQRRAVHHLRHVLPDTNNRYLMLYSKDTVLLKKKSYRSSLLLRS